MKIKKSAIKFIHQTSRRNVGKILKEGFKIKPMSSDRIPDVPWGVFGKDTNRNITRWNKKVEQLSVKTKGHLKEFPSRQKLVDYLKKVDPSIETAINKAKSSENHWNKKTDKILKSWRNNRENPSKERFYQKTMNQWRKRKMQLDHKAHTKMSRAMKRSKIDVASYDTNEGGFSNYGNKTFIMRSPKGAKVELDKGSYAVKFIKKNGRVIPIKVKK